MNANGSCGPFYSYNEATLTGLHLRKYLDPDLTLEEIGEGMSDQPFILMRYADVLLAAAESAVELAIAGAECPVAGDDMLQDSYGCHQGNPEKGRSPNYHRHIERGRRKQGHRT